MRVWAGKETFRPLPTMLVKAVRARPSTLNPTAAGRES